MLTGGLRKTNVADSEKQMYTFIKPGPFISGDQHSKQTKYLIKIPHCVLSHLIESSKRSRGHGTNVTEEEPQKDHALGICNTGFAFLKNAENILSVGNSKFPYHYYLFAIYVPYLNFLCLHLDLELHLEKNIVSNIF